MRLCSLLGCFLFFGPLGLSAAPPTPLLAPGTEKVFPIRACGLQGALYVVDSKGALYRFNLVRGERSKVKAPASFQGIACGADSLWGITEEWRSLYRFDPNGQVLERLPQPTLIWDVAVDGAELVLARRPLAGGEKLLWRGKPP